MVFRVERAVATVLSWLPASVQAEAAHPTFDPRPFRAGGMALVDNLQTRKTPTSAIAVVLAVVTGIGGAAGINPAMATGVTC